MTPPQHARRSCAAQRVKDSLIHHVCMRCLVPGRLRGDVLSECPSGCPGGVDSSAAASSMHVAMAPRTAAITWSGAVADRSMSQSSPLSPLAASAMALAPAGALVTTAGTPAPAPERDELEEYLSAPLDTDTNLDLLAYWKLNPG